MGGKFKSPGIKGDSGGLVLMAGLEFIGARFAACYHVLKRQ